MNEKLPKIEAKKSLGQHFLNSPRVPELMAEAGNVAKGDTVLEIGPGTGVLTRELLKRGAMVIAIEADMRAIESLKETFESEITAKTLKILYIWYGGSNENISNVGTKKFLGLPFLQCACVP